MHLLGLHIGVEEIKFYMGGLIMEKLLLDYVFTYVCDIEPAKNIDGTIKEFHPEKNNNKGSILNKYGEGPFCKFSISPKWSGVMGVYALFFDDELKYIGQCIDFAKRFNQGYGQIQSRNCFVKGQSTNCKINKFIFSSIGNGICVKLHFFETNLYDEVESKLIEHYKPMLNAKRGVSSSKNSCKETIKFNKKKCEKKPSRQLGVDDVYDHLCNLLEKAKENDLEHLEVKAGNIHNELGLEHRMPTVCDAMYKLKKENDIIMYSPPKGKGSRLTIKFII